MLYSYFRLIIVIVLISKEINYVLQVYVDSQVKKAYDNWNQVVEYDGKSLLSLKQNKRSNASKNELQIGQIDFSNALDNQLQLSRLPAAVPTEQSSAHSGHPIGGKYFCLHVSYLCFLSS